MRRQKTRATLISLWVSWLFALGLLGVHFSRISRMTGVIREEKNPSQRPLFVRENEEERSTRKAQQRETTRTYSLNTRTGETQQPFVLQKNEEDRNTGEAQQQEVTTTYSLNKPTTETEQPLLLQKNEEERSTRKEQQQETTKTTDSVDKQTKETKRTSKRQFVVDEAYDEYVSAAAKSRWITPMKACELPPYSDDWDAPVTHQRGEPLLMFSYPKVGSSTTQYFFLLATPNGTLPNVKMHKRRRRAYFPDVEISNALGAHVVHMHHNRRGYRRFMQTTYKDKPIWIITIVRNRFVRDISALMESASYFDLQEDDPFDVAVSRLKRWFYQVHEDNIKESTNIWYSKVFKKDLRAICGGDPVDVVAHAGDFNLTRRSLFFQSGRFRVLQLRFEDLEYWERIWAKFFPDIHPPPAMPHQRLKAEWRRIRNFQLLAATAYNETEIAHRTQDETRFFYTECENNAMAVAAANPINITLKEKEDMMG